MTKMVQLPVGGPNQQLPNVTDKESCSGGVPFTTTNPQATSTPTGKVQELQQTPETQCNAAESHSKNRRTSTRRLTSTRSDGVPSPTTGSSSSASCLSMSHSPSSSSLKFPSTFETETCSVESGAFKVPSVADSSESRIICRLPLDRLKSILSSLDISKRSSHTPANNDAIQESSKLIVAVEHEAAISKALQQPGELQPLRDDYGPLYKLLCLYCERTFSNQKLMFKHTDRVHKLSKERRSSSRVVTTANNVDVSLCCTFCCKGRTLKPTSHDLPQLFKHLIAVHSDRYFACEQCVLRFPCEEAREAHMEAIHPAANGARPKSKAALKAFSNNRSNATNHSLHQTSTSAIKSSKTMKKNTMSGGPTNKSSVAPDNLNLEGDTTIRPNRTNVEDQNEKDHNADMETLAAGGQTVRLRSSPRNTMSQSLSRGDGKSKMKTIVYKKSERLLMRSAEPMLLSRLGITQHRLPRQSRRLLAIASSCARSEVLSSSSAASSSSSSLSSSSSSTSSSSSSSLSSSSSSSSSSFSTSATSTNTAGRPSSRKKHIAMTNEEEPPQLENCFIKLTKLKNIRSTLNNFPITATPDDGGGADLVNIISDSSTGRSNTNDFAPTTTIVAVTGTGGTNGHGGAGCGFTTVNANGGNDANSNTMCSSNSSIISNSVSNTCNQGSSFGVFDEDFYENVSSNVNINLHCYLDGKLQTTLTNTLMGVDPSTAPALRSIVVRSPVATDSKIYEATNLPAGGVMFPTLLTVEQYGTDSVVLASSAVKTKKPITKNSWKWKWDFVKKYKYVNENGRIVKKIKQPTLGLRDLSKLDMWTQLTMRTKHEEVRKRSSPDDARDQPLEETGAVLRQNKQEMVDQLDHILDARLLPQIDLEQNDQRIIKVEQVDEQSLAEITEQSSSKRSESTSLGLETKRITPENVAPTFLVSLGNSRRTNDCVTSSNMTSETDFLQGLQLMKLVRHNNLLPVVLSGEWARPRCYICYGCGDKFNSLKQVEEHRIFRHPHVYSTFYEIVGRELIEKRLYKHFFIPFTALAAHRLHYLRLAEPERDIEHFDSTTEGTYGMNIEIKNEDSSSNEATSVSTTTSAALASSSRSSISSSSITTLATLMDASADCVTSLTRYPPTLAQDEGESRTVVCSKCQKECQNMLVLYAHMLHCSNDYVWLQAKKRMKYRRARRRRGGNRNTSSAGGGLSCAASLLATVRKAQQQQLQNAVEKSETASTTSTSSSKEGGGSLSSDVTNSSNISTNSTSNSSIGSSSHSPNTKKPKSPKPKDSDSDIVKRLLANLPAKRNSRQIILQTTKQISKRSNVKGRTPLVASSKAAKGVTLKCRNTLGTAVATRISVTKDNKKANISSRSAAASGSSRNTDTPVPVEASSGAALSGTPVSPRNLRSTSSEHSRSPPGEATVTVSGSTRSKWTSTKTDKKNLISKQRAKREKKSSLMKEIEGEKKVLQWKKTRRQFRRMVTNGKRILRSGCSRDLSGSGRKSQLVTKSMKINNRKSNSKRSSRSSVVTSHKSPSKDVTLLALSGEPSANMQCTVQVDSAHGEDVKLHQTDDQKPEDVEETLKKMNDGNEKQKKGSEENSLSNIQTSNLAVTEKANIICPLSEQLVLSSRSDCGENVEQESVSTCTATSMELQEDLPVQHDEDAKAVCERSKLFATTNNILRNHQEDNLTCSRSPSVQSDRNRNDMDVAEAVISSSSSVINCSNSRTPIDNSSQSPASKRKPKKLNDCIAMLTGKLSERLGVDFFNSQLQRKKSGTREEVCQAVPEKNSETAVATQTMAPPMLPDKTPFKTSNPEINGPTFHTSCDEKLCAPMPCKNAIATISTDIQTLNLELQNSPQTTPVPLVMSTRTSEARSVRASVVVPPLKNVSPIQVEQNVFDEPLNLSKTSVDHRNISKSNLMQAGSQIQQQHELHPQQQTYPQQHQHVACPVSPVRSTESHLQHHIHRKQPASHQQKYLHPHLVQNPLHQIPPRNSQIGSKAAMSSATLDQTQSTASSCTITAKAGSGNLSSIKLPPGLIIERVEYKQSRPIISKEAPSVTIVARHRQVPPSSFPLSEEATESRKMIAATSLPSATVGIPTPPFAHSLPMSDSQQTSMQQHYCSGREHVRKVFDGCSGHIVHPPSVSADQLSTSVRVMPLEKPTQTVVPFVENRISVTITEAKPPERLQDVRIRPRNNSASASCSLPSGQAQPLKSQEIDKAMPLCFSSKPQHSASSSMFLPTQTSVAKLSSFRHHQLPQSPTDGGAQITPEKPQHTTLIIPHVPMPYTPSQAASTATKRTRRKSIFVSPTDSPSGQCASSSRDAKKSTSVNNPMDALRTILAPAPSSFPPSADSLCRANMLASMSFSLLPPGLLGGPHMGLDLQRLAAVGLPAHLKPPVIPPLTVPVSTASSATLLEKILQPTRTEALSNALEQSLKNAQVRPSEQLATSDVHVPFLSNQTAGGKFGQHKIDDSGANPLEQLQPSDVVGLSPHLVEKSTTQASGKTKKSSTTGRSTKRSTLGDYDRKALMEQIWNASIVDAMMEKDANFEVSRMMENSTIPIQQEQVNCDDGLKPKERQVPLLEINDSASVGLSERRLVSPIVNTTQEKSMEDENDLFRPRNNSIANENSQQSRINSHEECERLEQQKDQAGTQGMLSMLANAAIPVELETLPQSELNEIKELPSSLAQSMQAEDSKRERTGEKRLGEKDLEKICSSEHKTSDDTKNNDPRSELVENVKQTEEKEETDCAVGSAGCVSDVSQPDHTATPKLDNPSTTESVTPTPKVIRKRRKNELASILSDQLLESFKEVDKSRLNDLKLLHDITCETPDVKFTLEQIPQLAKRKSNPRLPELVQQSVSDPSKTSAVSSAIKKGGIKKVAREAPTPTDGGNQRNSEKVGETFEMARNDKQCGGSEKLVHEDLKGDTKLEHGSSERKNASTVNENTKQPTLAPTRRTRKLSVDIERLPPTVVERMAQKMLSRKNAGLDIEVPKIKKNVIGKSAKTKGKDKCTVPPEESLVVEKLHSEMTTVVDELGKNNVCKAKRITNAETSVACLPEKDRKTSKLKHGQQTATPVDDDAQTLGTEKHISQRVPLSAADSVGEGMSEEAKKMLASAATVVATPKKRERRKSVFVDRNMAKYVERDTEDEDRLHSVSGSCKDDLSLTLRRGMRSQDKTDFTRMDSFIETSMNPRDPRRRIVRKRIEEERAAAVTASKADNKEESSKSENSTPDAPTKEDKQKHSGIVADMTKNAPADAVVGSSLTPNTLLTKPEVEKTAPLRRISTRRSSVFVRSPTPPAPVPSPTATAEQKAPSSEARKIEEDETLRTIGNETKRIYRRRASIYQAPVEMLELDDIEKQEPEKKKKPSQQGTRRSKTPGPGDWNRRTQLRINGKPEPSIESLLLQVTNSSDSCQSGNALNGPKRRTTKNSQIAETVSKLFNIQEEIMLIDSTRRKSKKTNTASLSSLVSPVPKVADIAVASADSVIGGHLNRPEEVGFLEGVAPVKTLTAQHLTNSIALTDIKDNTITTNDNQPSPLPASSLTSALAPPPPPPRKSISFSNDEDDSPKVINELVENILKNAHDSDTSNDSEDDNMSLACFVAQKGTQGVQRREELLEKAQSDGGSLTDMYIPVRAMSVADDDSTTYTDGMDDDLMSVTTELAPSTGNMYGGRGRRKRRQLVRGSKRKRQQAKAKAQAQSEDKHMLTFNCDLCRKVFKKQDAYNKHRMTLTHIAKLSEQEYIQSQAKQQQQEKQQKQQHQQPPGAVQNHISKEQNDEHNEAQSFSEDQEVPHSLSLVQPVDSLHETIGQHATSSLLLAYPQLEDVAADAVLNPKDLHKHSLKALSQEEKLFYECCSMLKESNTSEGDTLSVTVSLKTNEIDHAESIPPLTVPVEGDDKFGDTQYPLPVRSPASYMAQANIPVADSMASQCVEHSVQSSKKATQQKVNFQTFRDVCGGENFPAQGSDETNKPNKSDTAENYGNISPQNSTKSTSTTSSSSNAKIKTKGALKGYDNFKVSIPMTGIIMSANTGGVAPDTIDGNGECSAGTNAKESRLDTLADVALCGDIPKEFGVYDCKVDLKSNTIGIECIPSTVQSNIASLANPERNKDQQHMDTLHNTVISEETLAKANVMDSCIAENDAKNCETKNRGTRSNRSSMSRKRRKIEQKQKQATSKGAPEGGAIQAQEVSCQRTTPDDDDVYAFQDSPSDDALPGTYSSKKSHDVAVSSGTHGDQQQPNPATGSPVREDQEDSQVSSLSFSDRDDFVYGTHTMSDEDEEEEEGKSSSNSSGQTTPKRKTKADVQKKSLIMGRIFKKGGKREKQKENIATKADLPASCVGSKASAMDPSTVATTKTAVAKDFDKLFDTLKNASSHAEMDVDRITRLATDKRHSDISEKEPNGTIDGDIIEDKMREFLEHDGAEMTNRLRRTATVRQKKLTETWDSDEYEDFHSDDIMGLIDRADDRERNDDEALSIPAERTESKESVLVPYIGGLSLKPRSDQTERQQAKEIEHNGSELMGKSSVPLAENKQPAATLDVVVTDDTIRKVMESVILETMNHKSPMAGNNRKSSTKSHKLSNRTSRITTPSGTHGANVCKEKEDSQTNTVERDPDDTQELTTSLNEHVLESSVVISSQTITTKFKQKLNISRRNTANSEPGRLKNDSNTNAMKGKLKESKKSKLVTAPIEPILTHSESRDNSLISINSFTNNNNNNIHNNNNNHSNKSNTNKVKQSRTANSSKLDAFKPGTKAKGRGGNESSFVVAKHSGRGRPPMALTTGSRQKKSAPRKMKNVAYDPDSDYEHSIKYKKVKRKLLESDIEANLKIEQLQSSLNSDSSILLSTPRRKRNAGDMLYYWSSSSDEEELSDEGGHGFCDGTAAKAEKLNHRSRPPRVNKSSPVAKQSRDSIKPRMKNSESTGDILLADNTNDGGDAGTVGHGDYRAALTQSSARQPTDVGLFEPNGGKLPKPTPNIFENTATATSDGANDEGTTTGKHVRGRKQQQLQQSTQGKPSSGYDVVADTSSNSENLQQHGWIVGDSHKKLVTLLAHAKGKQDSRKTANHRRK